MAKEEREKKSPVGKELLELEPEEGGVSVREEVFPDDVYLIDRLLNWNGGVNFREDVYVKRNELIKAQNLWPADVPTGRPGQTEFYDGSAFWNKVTELFRYYGTANLLLAFGPELGGAPAAKVAKKITDGAAATTITIDAPAFDPDDDLFTGQYNNIFFASNGTTTKWYDEPNNQLKLTTVKGGQVLRHGTGMAFFEDRMWLIDLTNKTWIWYSAPGVFDEDPFAGELDFPSSNILKIETGVKDEIKALVPISLDAMIVLGLSQCYLITGVARFDYAHDKIPVDTGIISAKAWAIVNDLLYFVSPKGVYVMDAGGGFKIISGNIRPIFTSGHDWSINRAYPVHATNIDGYFCFFYRISDGTRVGMVYDPERHAWFPQKGLNPACEIQQLSCGDTGQIRMGHDDTGKISTLTNSSYVDLAGNIAVQMKTAYLHQTMPECYKQYLGMIADIRATVAGTVTVTIDVDERFYEQVLYPVVEAALAWGTFNWGDSVWNSRVGLAKDLLEFKDKMEGLACSIQLDYAVSTSRLTCKRIVLLAKPRSQF